MTGPAPEFPKEPPDGVGLPSARLPVYGGMPVALLGTLPRFVGCLVSITTYSIWCNLSGAAAGRRYCKSAWFVSMHMKRPGEKFATARLARTWSESAMTVK